MQQLADKRTFLYGPDEASRGTQFGDVGVQLSKDFGFRGISVFKTSPAACAWGTCERHRHGGGVVGFGSRGVNLSTDQTSYLDGHIISQRASPYDHDEICSKHLIG